MTATFQTIPLTDISPSKSNPRKHFDAKRLEELAESIKEKGVLQPVLVRPNGQGYELVAGERRYRAAKMAGLQELPAVIRQLDDTEVVECQTIENLQREDVHPLEEAAGYHQLMKLGKYDASRIAAKVGRSVKYVYDRMKLLELTKEAQDLFWDGKIQAGHAILLARLSPSQQQAVLGDKRHDYADGGLFQGECGLYLDEESDSFKVRSVRELEDHIKRHVRFDARNADGFLFPDTVRQVQDATQAKTKIIEITHDYLASDEVRHAGEAKVYGERAWRRADGKEKSKPCDRSVLGVIVSGPGQGEAFKVCVNKDRCLVHWGAEIKARQKRQKDLAKGGASADRVAQQQNSERERREREQAARREREERWSKATPAIFKGIAERIKTMPLKPSGLLCQVILEKMGDTCDVREADARKLAPIGSTLEQLVRHLAFLALADRVEEWNAEEQFPKFAKSFGLDVQKIMDQVSPPEKDEAKKHAKDNGKKKQAA